MNWKLLALLLLIGFGAYQSYQKRAVTHPAGVLVAQAPMQETASAQPMQINGYTITPVQAYQLQARVLSTQQYRTGREADLSPVDLALGWGQMSDEAVISQIRISQSNRFYFWSVDSFPIPRQAIETQSANVHMIPANETLADKLTSVRKGQVVKLKGYLVNAEAADGWRWKSSLSRSDTGNGACELMYVTDVAVN
jgi:hypothetical protein